MSTFTYLDLADPADDDRSARAASLRSRLAVQAHDKDAWVALFRPDGIVADPVGPSPLDEAGDGHRGHEAIAAFWDQTIGPNDVRMDIISSHAGGNEVANYLTITTSFADGSNVALECVALYRVDDDGKVEALRAFWQFDAMRFTPAP